MLGKQVPDWPGEDGDSKKANRRREEEFAHVMADLDHRPKLVIDRNCRVKWCCDRSKRLLNNPLPLCLRNGRLIVEDELTPGQFTQFLSSLDDEPRRFLIRGRQNPQWVMICAWRSSRHDGDIFLFCSLSVPHCQVEASGIASDFALTRAETMVLAQFAHLKSPKQIASDLGITLSTVRSHIKQIYSKTAVQTGVQLHQLVHTYCSV